MAINRDMPQLVSTIAYKSSAASPDNESMQDASGVVDSVTTLTNPQMRAAVMPHTEALMTGNFQPKGGVLRMAFTQLRKVKQYFTDPNPNIPLLKRIIYEGPEFFTDESDGDLAYRLNLQELLTEHNKFRVTVKDKSFRDRNVFLEEARFSDLKLVTVTLALIG